MSKIDIPEIPPQYVYSTPKMDINTRADTKQWIKFRTTFFVPLATAKVVLRHEFESGYLPASLVRMMIQHILHNSELADKLITEVLDKQDPFKDN